MFASADPLAFFDFSSPSWMLETRVAGIPQPFQNGSHLGFCSDFTYTQSSTTKTSLGFSGLSLMTPSSSLSAFPIFFLALISFPSSTFPHPSAVVLGNGEEAGTLLQLGAQASTGNTSLLFHAVGASQEHSFHSKCCWALARSGVEHVCSFFRELIWCQLRTQLGLYEQWSQVFTLQQPQQIMTIPQRFC